MVDESRKGFFFLVGGEKNKNKICMVNDIGKKGSHWADLCKFKARLIKRKSIIF